MGGKSSAGGLNNKTDFLSLIREAYPKMTKSDKKIARFLLQSPEQFVKASVQEVAVLADVSDATVVRFGRNLGCGGFKDLKILLVENLAIEQALKDIGESHTKENLTAVSTDSFVDQIYAAALAVLQQAMSNLDPGNLDEAARIIVDSRRVFIYGAGGSSGILAMEIHNRLFRLNVVATPFTDNYLQHMSAATLGPNDAILVVSSTGRPRELQESAELARHYGAKIIAITDRNSLLSTMADVCIHVELSQSGVAHNQPNPMRFAQLFVLDCLAYKVAVLLGDVADESLRRIRASVAFMHGIVSQQPIGD